MIKEISMPMMAPSGGGSLVSELTWDDIPSAGPCDIQSGRNVYIELNEDQTCTKASAGKILQFIKEGFMPVLKVVDHNTKLFVCNFLIPNIEGEESVITYALTPPHSSEVMTLYAYSDALDKPFTTVRRGAPGSGAQQQ